MSDSAETVLRNSLDAVDRGRRWAVLGVVALLLATVISVAGLFGVAAAAASGQSSAAGILKVVFVGATSQMLFTACCTVVVMFHVSRTTKTLLRAMELRDR
jgi:hypothetical protein